MATRIRRATGWIILLSLFFGSTMNLSAQMDMMPEIFRDLPPELQDGLPADMSYREYRQMTRNVDFFTMFMSMWVPGYGMFQVERPALGWTIAGVRVAGYGLMGAAMYRQWDDIRNLSDPNSLQDLPLSDVLVNSALFAGGMIINGLGWAGDVVGAYHTAKTEKDLVLYSYGIRTESPAAQGDAKADTDTQQQEIRYIRHLMFQDVQEEPQVSGELMRALIRYSERYPDGEHQAEVGHYIGTRLADQDQPVKALAALIRQIYFHPDARYSVLSRQRAAALVQEHRHAWSQDRDTLLDLIESNPDTEIQELGRSRRILQYLQALTELNDPDFISFSIDEARATARRFPTDNVGSAALLIAGRQAERLDHKEEAVYLYSELAVSRPDSAEAPEALLQIARLLESLDESEYAQRFYARLVKHYPESTQASSVR